MSRHCLKVTLAGYKRHLEVESAPGPLSRAEEEMKEIKESETRVEVFKIKIRHELKLNISERSMWTQNTIQYPVWVSLLIKLHSMLWRNIRAMLQTMFSWQ